MGKQWETVGKPIEHKWETIRKTMNNKWNPLENKWEMRRSRAYC